MFTEQADLVVRGICTEAKAQEVINKQGLPLVGERQTTFEKTLEEMDVSIQCMALSFGTLSQQLFSLKKMRTFVVSALSESLSISRSRELLVSNSNKIKHRIMAHFDGSVLWIMMFIFFFFF